MYNHLFFCFFFLIKLMSVSSSHLSRSPPSYIVSCFYTRRWCFISSILLLLVAVHGHWCTTGESTTIEKILKRTWLIIIHSNVSLVQISLLWFLPRRVVDTIGWVFIGPYPLQAPSFTCLNKKSYKCTICK